jgi:hypothetical protein
MQQQGEQPAAAAAAAAAAEFVSAPLLIVVKVGHQQLQMHMLLPAMPSTPQIPFTSEP